MEKPAMLEALLAWFSAQEPALQAATIGSATTITVFALGFISLVVNASLNRDNAVRSDRDKQKLQIYEAALKRIEPADVKAILASAYARSIVFTLSTARALADEGLPWTPPRQRFDKLRRRHDKMVNAHILLHRFLEQWAIIDPRLVVFNETFSIRLDAAQSAMRALVRDVVRVLPTGVHPWTIPSTERIEELRLLANNYADACSALSSCYEDLNVELQGLLLGHLFKDRLVRREPPDPQFATVRLDHWRKIQRENRSTVFWQTGERFAKEARQRFKQKT